MTTQRSLPSLEDGGTLRDFITRIEQGIYIVTPDGRLLDANPALLRIFRAQSVEQLRGYRSEDLVADPDVLRERRRLLARDGWIRGFPYEIRCLDGSARMVRDTVFTQRDEAGRIEALHGILEPVDGDAPLPEAPLSAFFAGAPAGLAILDADLRFVRINDRLAELHLLPVEEHLNRSLSDVLPGLTPIVEPILRDVLEASRPVMNRELATEDPASPGLPRIWRFSAFPVGPVEHSPTGVGIVVIDITEGRRMEEQARLDEAYLAAIIEGCPLAMVTLDPAGGVLAVNAAFERLFHMPREQILGRDLDEVIASPEQLEEARSLTLRTQGGEQLRVEVERLRGDGTKLRLRAHGSPIVLDGQHVGAQVLYEALGND